MLEYKILLSSSAPSCQLAGAAVDYGSARRPDALIRGPSTSGSAARNNKGTTGKLISLDGEEEENEDAIGAQVRESPFMSLTIVVIVRIGESLLPPLQEYTVLVGNRKWLRDKNFIEIPADVENRLAAQERMGRTALLAAIDGGNKKKMFFLQCFPLRVRR